MPKCALRKAAEPHAPSSAEIVNQHTATPAAVARYQVVAGVFSKEEADDAGGKFSTIEEVEQAEEEEFKLALAMSKGEALRDDGLQLLLTSTEVWPLQRGPGRRSDILQMLGGFDGFDEEAEVQRLLGDHPALAAAFEAERGKHDVASVEHCSDCIL